VSEGARLGSEGDLVDIDWILEIVLAEQASMRGGELFGRREVVNLSEDIRRALADRQGTTSVVVGTYDDVVLGVALVEIEQLVDGGLLGRLGALAVHPEARKAGIGEAMMQHVLEQLRSAGCLGVDATALPGDRHTKNFFESFGLKARMLTVHLSLSASE
jgi:GNAT superfamily N-acetyltransferase